MATASDFISDAALKVGLYPTAAAQKAEALAELNRMIQMWSVEMGNYPVISESLAITSAAAQYSVGSGGDLDTVRPLSVKQCFIRDGDGYDYPVLPMSPSEYSSILDKDISVRPTKYYFNPEFPLALITFNSYPDQDYTAYFEFIKVFTALASTTTTIDATWPPEYLHALIDNLSVRLGEMYDRVVKPSLYKRAEESKAMLDGLNASNQTVGRAKFDFRDGGRYNINTDEWGR